jgi:UDP-2,3-diacylglucosamine pyrophosphatase LpxH
MSIVVASDQHLGYTNSNAEAFRDFLGQVSKRKDVKSLVILGDFVDMWRRDVSGLFLEFSDIVQTTLALRKKMGVYCVGGNHDFHLTKLSASSYPLTFARDLTLQGDGVTYVLKHGWEFDFEQREPIMELLCENFSDDAGTVRTGIWDTLKQIKAGITDSVQDLLDLHQGGDAYIQNLMTPPNKRLAASYSDVEKNAMDSVQAGQILVFGHTHRPFVSASGNVANSGSWVSDEDVTNTYVELQGKEVRVMQQGTGDITQRVQRR